MDPVKRSSDFVEDHPESLLILGGLAILFFWLRDLLAGWTFLIKIVGVSVIVTLAVEAFLETDPAKLVRERIFTRGKNDIHLTVLVLIAGSAFGTNLLLRYFLGQNLAGLYSATLIGGIVGAFRIYVNVSVDRNPVDKRQTLSGDTKRVEWGDGINDGRKDTWAIYIGCFVAMVAPYGIERVLPFIGVWLMPYEISAASLILGVGVGISILLEYWKVPYIEYINS